jgi:hypothetical protein
MMMPRVGSAGKRRVLGRKRKLMNQPAVRPAKIRINRPRRCAVCRHPERARIELLRADGAAYEALSKKFGVHRDAIWRFWRDHVSTETKGQYFAGPIQLHELAQRAAAEGLSLLDYLSIVRSTWTSP